MLPLLRHAALLACVFLAAASPLRADLADDHLALGNPSGATADRLKPDNYLLKKRQYTLSYNSSKGTPNWVSWHLSKDWLGSTRRGNPFAPDLTLPTGFLQVRPNDYRGSGFDRGHLCPAADRSVSTKDMDATFSMSNMVPQAPKLNRGAWEKLESYCRDQVRHRGHDLYILAGPSGQGGAGSDGPRTTLRGARGAITVPARCWKVVLAIPSGSDARKVSAEQARVFSVIMPNTQEVSSDWRDYAVSVGEVEKATGYTFFERLPRALAVELKARKPQTRDTGAKSVQRVTGKKAGGVKGLELPAFKEGCVVANRQTKIYHLPGGRYYESGKSSKNAVFFKDEADAKKAGYRASKR